MFEAMTNAVEELKRVDHLIYVSLKYTRTVDVIRSVVSRIMDCYGAIIDGFLENLEEEGKIMEIPQAPMIKVQEIKKNFPKDEELIKNLEFYVFLRQLYRADFKRDGEFRKKVTMISEVPGHGTLEITMDSVMEYYEKTKKFLHHIKDTYVKDE